MYIYILEYTMKKRGSIQGILIIVLLLVAGLVISSYINDIFGVNDISGKITADSPDLCYFLDSNGDCTTTAFDVSAAINLASLKSISCPMPDQATGNSAYCRKTLDANGDGVITSLDVSILKNKASL